MSHACIHVSCSLLIMVCFQEVPEMFIIVALVLHTPTTCKSEPDIILMFSFKLSSIFWVKPTDKLVYLEIVDVLYNTCTSVHH